MNLNFLYKTRFPLGLKKLENLEKWEGILNRLEKSGKITQGISEKFCLLFFSII